MRLERRQSNNCVQRQTFRDGVDHLSLKQLKNYRVCCTSRSGDHSRLCVCVFMYMYVCMRDETKSLTVSYSDYNCPLAIQQQQQQQQ